MLQEVREQTQGTERSLDPDALRCSQHATKPLTHWRGRQRGVGVGGSGSREKQYLYLTRREQRKEAQSCSREAKQKRGHRAMGLWQERPGRKQAEGQGGGVGGSQKREAEEKKQVIFSFIDLTAVSLNSCLKCAKT